MNRPVYKLPAVIIPAAMVWLLSGCTGSGLFSGKREKTVGKDIAIDDITEFYWTYATSTFPPEYQRYYFSAKDGMFRFYHETGRRTLPASGRRHHRIRYPGTYGGRMEYLLCISGKRNRPPKRREYRQRRCRTVDVSVLEKRQGRYPAVLV